MSSSVNNKNKDWARNRFVWRAVRDAIAGTNAVKRANEVYLPIPSGFLIEDTPASMSQVQTASAEGVENREDYLRQNAPYYHRNPAYRGYLQRARFPELAMHTMRGLLGIATKNPAVVKLPSSIAYMEESATVDGDSLEELFVYSLSEVLQTGRLSLVVDVNDKTNEVHIAPHRTESFINWKEKINENLTMAVYESKVEEQSLKDEFEVEEKTVNIVYTFANEAQAATVEGGEVGDVFVRRYVDGTESVNDATVPNLQGTKFEDLPIVNIGSINNDATIDPAPLLGIAEIAYSIYRKDADLSQAQYMTCNPNLVITGCDDTDAEGNPTGVPNVVGSTVALIIGNPEAKVFYTKTDTSALDHVLGSIEKLFEEGATYGAALVGPSKGGAESTDTMKIRQGAQGATLVSVVKNVAKGIEDALKKAAQISGASEDSVQFAVTTDFAERMLDPAMLTALVAAWMDGIYSKESLIKVMIEAGYISKEDTVDEELARIASEPPKQNEGAE